MGKITERNSDRSTINTWGYVSISPIDDVVVGSFATWKIKFTVGAYAMDVGGGLKIGTRRQSDFGHPQFNNPEADNYTTVSCSREEARFEAYFDPRGHKRPFNAVSVIRLVETPLYPGDTITITLGNKSKGSRGLAVQSFPESECDFAVFLDPLSSGEYKRVFCQSSNFSVLSGPVKYFTIVAPSIVEVGKPFRVQVRGNDKFGNPTQVKKNRLTLEGDSSVNFSLSHSDGRAKWLNEVILKSVGVHRLKLRDGAKVLAISNPVVVKNKIDEIICWGDTQAQTASTVGVGSPDEYFAYARDLAAIDFTTHQGNDFILSDNDLEEVRLAAKKFNEPGRFAAFFGWEWSGPTGTGGDRNVMFLDDEGPIYRSSHWQLGSDEILENSVATEAQHARDLQEKMRSYMNDTGRKVIMVPHIGGRRSDFQAQDPELEPVFEICSNHGIFEWRLHEFLEAGVHVGVVGASDDHTCRPGLAYPSTPEMTVLGGLGAVLSQEISRDEIYKGMIARRCYGTTGARIYLDLTANKVRMGEVSSCSGSTNIKCIVHGTAPIEYIALFNRTNELYRFYPNSKIRDKKRIKIIWSGANHQDRGRFMNWNGGLEINSGVIKMAKPLNMQNVKYGINSIGERHINWRSITSGQEEGVLINIDASDNTIISFDAGPAKVKFKVGDVRSRDLSWDFGGLNQFVTASTLHTDGDKYDTEFEYNDISKFKGEKAYWVRVVQTDFHKAWSSPIYIKNKD